MSRYTVDDRNAQPVWIANLGDASIPVTTPTGTVVDVSGQSSVVAYSFTRPSDTTAYSANDTVSNATGTATIITFSNVARENGGSGQIVKVRIMTDQSTNTSTYRLHLYHTAPTMISDNSPFTLLWANRTSRIGTIDLGSMRTEGTGSNAAYAQNITDLLEFVCASGDRNIYGILETLVAFTPASAQNFYIELTARVD